MALLPFYLQANIAFAILLAAYAVGLRHSPLLGARRAFLLLSPAGAFALPLLPRIPVPTALAPVTLPLITVSPDAGTPLDPAVSLIAVHVGVSLVLIARLLWRIAVAGRTVRQGGPVAMAFLGRVHLPPHLAGAEREAVRQHELAHVRLGHSYDLIAFELDVAVVGMAEAVAQAAAFAPGGGQSAFQVVTVLAHAQPHAAFARGQVAGVAGIAVVVLEARR